MWQQELLNLKTVYMVEAIPLALAICLRYMFNLAKKTWAQNKKSKGQDGQQVNRSNLCQ